MLTLNFHPFPNLETPRLLLRRVVEADAPQIMVLRGDAENMKFVPRPLVTNIEQALQHYEMIDAKIVNNEGINWAITLKENPNKMLGIIGHYKIHTEHFRSEIGYMLVPELHGKGFVTEAIKAVLIYGFEVLNLHSVEAIIDPNNIASEKALLKNGFVKEAHILENEYYDGKFIDTVIYSLLKRNFKK